ncbi:MAG: pyridoxal phosphate-dependent aminotransferase [Anaerolineae bacterium]|nr:pyridoxal phosphate-dependent aminotransferase [Anaerolineae bacterium]
MSYNFDKIHHRGNTNSIKWDYINKDGVYQKREVGADPLAPDELIPMGLADMDFSMPPSVIDALGKRIKHGIMGYTRPPESYYAAIINWIEHRTSWGIQRDWILTTSGVMPTINLLIQKLTKPGDQVIIQTPVFYPFYHAVEFNDRVLLRNQLLYKEGHYSIDFDDLARKAADPRAKMIILSNPHNPVGRVWSKEELLRIGEICHENDLFIISDELHSDLTYSWAKFTSFGIVDKKFTDRLIICTGPSKAFNMPGLKTSLAIIPNQILREELTTALRNLNELFGVNTLGILALQKAYEEGEEWLTQLTLYLEGNYHYLQNYLGQHLPQLKVVRPEALYLIWIDCSALGLDVVVLKELLIDEAKVYVEAGSFYGAEGEGFIRINIGCPRAILETALERIRFAIQTA